MPKESRARSTPPEPPRREETGPRPTVEDLWFVNELSAAGLLDSLRANELNEIARKLGDSAGSTRVVQLLVTYYRADIGRRMADRFYLASDDEVITAPEIVERLAALNPEVGDVRIERIGSKDGPLVLRAGELVAGIVDDYEESLETGEIDLRDLEGETISVRGIVQAINVLLERVGVEPRMLPLVSDDTREVYVAVGPSSALALQAAGLVDIDDPDELMEHASW